MRILLSEGSSTSARQAITALSRKGHEIEVCDPDPHCLARFSRLVARVHRCPGIGVDPAGYLAFVVHLLSTGRFDVLLPIHEQGFLFAKVLDQIHPLAAVALPSFESYACVHSKAAFSRLLDQLELPQPRTRFVEGQQALLQLNQFPFVLKTPVGTASRGTWIIQTVSELQAALNDLQGSSELDDTLLVQDVAPGALEHAGAVFSHGEILGFHAWRQIMQGAGGGDAIKESIRRPVVREHITRLGQHLAWHGALSVDYILDEVREKPLYIDCNPRLVEPMGALLAGTDLADLLVRVSYDEALSPSSEGQEGVRTHMALQALLGHILAGGTRATLLREAWQLLVKRGPYAGSREELTPMRFDWPSVVPTIATALWLLADPGAALYLPKKGWGAHLLNPQSIKIIREMGAQLPPAHL